MLNPIFVHKILVSLWLVVGVVAHGYEVIHNVLNEYGAQDLCNAFEIRIALRL